MVIPYVGGKAVDTAGEDFQAVMARLTALNEPVVFRDDRGEAVATLVPQPATKEPFCPWDQNLTAEESERQARELPRKTLDEFWRSMGVK